MVKSTGKGGAGARSHGTDWRVRGRNARQFRPAAQQPGYDVLGDIGFEILREFWLETPRKLKFPCVRKPQSGTPILSAAKFAHIPNV
jgi:hypothetical protein